MASRLLLSESIQLDDRYALIVNGRSVRLNDNREEFSFSVKQRDFQKAFQAIISRQSNESFAPNGHYGFISMSLHQSEVLIIRLEGAITTWVTVGPTALKRMCDLFCD